MIIKMKVGFISLGCSKNLIDTEVAIGHFKRNRNKSRKSRNYSNKYMWFYRISQRRSNKHNFRNGRIQKKKL